MADNKTPPNTETAQETSRQGTASPATAQQEEKATPAPTSGQGIASPPAQQEEVQATTETESTTQEVDAQDEQEDLPELGEDQSDADSAFGGSEGSTFVKHIGPLMV